MWWTRPREARAQQLLPNALLDVVARAYATVEVGGLRAVGPERGRDFERLFYRMCERRGVHLTERAGSKSIATRRSASGFAHEIDAASRSVDLTTCWELKHLTDLLEKNELLIFNAKGQDFLYGGDALLRRSPLLRFLLSGRNVRDDCRVYGVQWGIAIIEPGRLPIPLLYEAVVRGAAPSLSEADQEAVRGLAPWACRSLQDVMSDVVRRFSADGVLSPASVSRRAKEVIEMQEQIGGDVLDDLEEADPDWVDNLAQAVWQEVGGWA